MTIPDKNNGSNKMHMNDFVSLSKKWFFYFRSKWLLFLIVGLLSCVAGYLWAHYQKPKYESRLTFALDDNNGGMNGAISLAAQFGFDIGGGNSDLFGGDNIVEILKSRRIVEGVLLSADSIDGKNISMADEFIKVAELNKKKSRISGVSFPYGTPRTSFNYLQDSVLFLIYSNITRNLTAKKIDKKLSIYELKLISPNERYSKIFIEKLIEQASAFYTELKIRRSKETLDVLEQRVGALKGSLNSAITARASVQDANINPAFAAAQAPLQKKQVEISAYGGAYGELFKNLELARYQYLKNIPLFQVIDNAQYPMHKIRKGRITTAALFGFCGFILLAIGLSLVKVFKDAGA